MRLHLALIGFATFLMFSEINGAWAINGNDWPQFPNDASMRGADLTYIFGMVDAWNGILFDEMKRAGSTLPTSISTPAAIAVCIQTENLKYGQVAAIVKKYRQEHPELWHREMFELAANAMTAACAKMRP